MLAVCLKLKWMQPRISHGSLHEGQSGRVAGAEAGHEPGVPSVLHRRHLGRAVGAKAGGTLEGHLWLTWALSTAVPELSTEGSLGG